MTTLTGGRGEYADRTPTMSAFSPNLPVTCS